MLSFGLRSINKKRKPFFRFFYTKPILKKMQKKPEKTQVKKNYFNLLNNNYQFLSFYRSVQLKLTKGKLDVYFIKNINLNIYLQQAMSF